MMSKLIYKIVNEGKCILVDKPVGLTPYQCVPTIRRDAQIPLAKLGYAGRLDPMACGLLLFLVGEENKNKHKYETLPKQYEVEVLLGISTDSQDLLGLVKETKITTLGDNFNLEKAIMSFVGKHKMQYPIFSSKRVSGKPLFYHARKRNVENINIPVREITINKIKITKKSSLTSKEILSKVMATVPMIEGHFRQEQILNRWKELLIHNIQVYETLGIVVDCESGTYMRWLAEKIGEKLNTPTLAYSIKRTKIGNFSMSELSVK